MEGGTGVFYQVMPAVGPDGKNVMKLIPVQKVNGQFIPTSTSSSINGLGGQTLPHPVRITPPSVYQNRIPVVEPTADGKFILKGPTNTNVRLTKSPQQVNPPKVLVGQVRLPVVAPRRTQNLSSCPVNASRTPAAYSNPSQLPVTVSSPRLPNGHYLQIPPDAKVQTLPASALPQSIKKRILNLPHDAASTEKPSTVVYVSPVNSMKIDTSKLKGSTSPVSQCITANVAKNNSTCSPSVLTQSLKTVTSDQMAPMKWVVQQKDKSSAPCLVPATSNCMASEILKAVAQMEKSCPSKSNTSSSTTTSPASSQQNQAKISPNKDNALVMCNGKVYFVTNKDSGLCVSEKPHTSHTPAKEGSTPRKPTQSPRSSSESPMSATAKHDSQPICIDVDPDEVIDLCDDDPQIDGTSGKVVNNKAGSLTEEEDDTNVIFVSYIPPKASPKETTKETSSGTGGDQLGQTVPVRSDGEQAKKVYSEHEHHDGDKQTGSNQNKITAEPLPGIKDRVDLITAEPLPGIKDRVDLINAETVSGIKDKVDLSTEEGTPDEVESVCDAAKTPANSEPETRNILNRLNNLSESNDQTVEDVVHLDTSSSIVPVDSSVSDMAPSNVSEEATPDSRIDGELESKGMELQSSDEKQVVQEGPSNVKDAVQMTRQDSSQEQSLTVSVNASIKKADHQSQHHYDCRMRKLFGITKEIKIPLKRSHSEKQDPAPETRSINKRTLEGIRRLIQGSQMEIKAKKLIEAQVHLGKDVKRRKVESSTDILEKPEQCEVADRPHGSPKYGLFDSLQSKMNTLTSDAGTQNNVPSACSGDSTTVSGQGLDTSKNTNRLPVIDAGSPAPEPLAARLQETSGRTGPSITVSCSSHSPISTPVVTSGKSDLQSEKESSTGTEESPHVGTQSPRSACEDTGSTSDVLNKDLFSTEAMEPEEIQRCEKIKRLKELLKEKEAALEAMRKRMSM